MLHAQSNSDTESEVVTDSLTRSASYRTVHHLMETILVTVETEEASLAEIFSFFEREYIRLNPRERPIRILPPDPLPPKVLDLSLQAIPMLEALKMVAALSLTKFRVHDNTVVFCDVNDKTAFFGLYDLEDWKLEAKRLFSDLRDERRPLFKQVAAEVVARSQANPEFFEDLAWPVRITSIVAERLGIGPDISNPTINLLEYTPSSKTESFQNDGTAVPAKEIAKRSLPAVFTVLVTDRSGKLLSQGSAFLFTPSHLITNVHVIAAGKTARIYVTNSHIDQPISVIAVRGFDERTDLAVLEVEANLGTPLPVAVDAAEIGDTIYAVGTPKGLEGTFSTGLVSGFREQDGVEHLQISAPVSPGSSGGPVLNASGEVIAVAVSTLESGQNLNFAIPVDYVLDLIDKILAE